jgi:hypothetical protein
MVKTRKMKRETRMRYSSDDFIVNLVLGCLGYSSLTLEKHGIVSKAWFLG